MEIFAGHPEPNFDQKEFVFQQIFIFKRILILKNFYLAEILKKIIYISPKLHVKELLFPEFSCHRIYKTPKSYLILIYIINLKYISYDITLPKCRIRNLKII